MLVVSHALLDAVAVILTSSRGTLAVQEFCIGERELEVSINYTHFRLVAVSIMEKLKPLEKLAASAVILDGNMKLHVTMR
jgi:hypothetical protein